MSDEDLPIVIQLENTDPPPTPPSFHPRWQRYCGPTGACCSFPPLLPSWFTTRFMHMPGISPPLKPNPWASPCNLRDFQLEEIWGLFEHKSGASLSSHKWLHGKALKGLFFIQTWLCWSVGLWGLFKTWGVLLLDPRDHDVSGQWFTALS